MLVPFLMYVRFRHRYTHSRIGIAMRRTWGQTPIYLIPMVARFPYHSLLDSERSPLLPLANQKSTVIEWLAWVVSITVCMQSVYFLFRAALPDGYSSTTYIPVMGLGIADLRFGRFLRQGAACGVVCVWCGGA
jgi:hypothetical protein